MDAGVWGKPISWMELLTELTSSSYMWKVRIWGECSRINPSCLVSGDLQIPEDTTALVIYWFPKFCLQHSGLKNICSTNKGTALAQGMHSRQKTSTTLETLPVWKEEKATLWLAVLSEYSLCWKYTGFNFIWIGPFWKDIRYPKSMFRFYRALPMNPPESRIFTVQEQRRQDECVACSTAHTRFSALSSSPPFPDMICSISHLGSKLSAVSVFCCFWPQSCFSSRHPGGLSHQWLQILIRGKKTDVIVVVL